MEDKKQIKISLNTIIILVFVIFLIIGLIVSLEMKKQDEKGQEKTRNDKIEVKTYENKEYYIIKGDYSGEYDIQSINLRNISKQEEILTEFSKKNVMNYSEYELYCNEWRLEKKYSDSSKNYIVFSYIAFNSSNLKARLAEVEYNGNSVNLYVWDNSSGVTVDISAYCIIIPTEKKIDNINVIGMYTNEEFNNIKKYNTPFNPEELSLDKPVIYLYPTEETEICVKLLNAEKITCSYPKYVDGWNVLAKENGDLKDLKTGRNLYALYYESENIVPFKMEKEGFIVKGEDSAKFLEEKLAVLGLTEREAEEFIIYWLPKLESNKYNYIRFATEETINKNMPLEINPVPDTLIRVIMIFKELQHPIEIEEQKLNSVERKGFVAVEWGGTEIK